MGFKKVCLQSLHFNPPLVLLKDPATLPPSLLFLSLLNQILHLPPSNIPLYPTKGTLPLKRASRVGWKCPYPQTHRASPHQGGRSPHTKVGDHPTPLFGMGPTSSQTASCHQAAALYLGRELWGGGEGLQRGNYYNYISVQPFSFLGGAGGKESAGQEDALEKEMATHSSVLA